MYLLYNVDNHSYLLGTEDFLGCKGPVLQFGNSRLKHIKMYLITTSGEQIVFISS